jgi:hypothetical protein
MAKEKISREQAEKEITAWLDKKKVFEETRERQKDQIEMLIEAMMNDVLVLNPTSFAFTHTLMLPPVDEEGNATITELVYAPRLNDKLIEPYTKGLKENDLQGRFNAICAALTKQPRSIISLLDSADKRITSAIAIFFI